MMRAWKKLAIVSLFGGFGFVVGFAATAGVFLWYKSRPPKPWNTSALVTTEARGFSISADGKSLELKYTVTNNTDRDYSLNDEEAKRLRIVMKFGDGTLSPSLENKRLSLTNKSLFIPAKQEVALSLSVNLFSDLLTQNKIEAHTDYHERLVKYLETAYADVSGFVLYDEATRYQINLPKWSEKPAY
jgi:hypothetical protein